MTYKINKTNGEVLSTVLDGSYDSKSTSLTLIGKNAVNFGESINENFVRLLENFSNESQPEHAIKGQLWYDASSDRLNVFNGSTFVNTTGTIVQSAKPTTNVDVGNIWLDSTNSQLYVCDSISTISGPSFKLVGPVYSASQNVSGFVIKSIIGTDGAAHVVSVVYVSNNIVGFYSKDSFEQSATSPFRIDAYTGIVQIGYNAVLGTSNLTSRVTFNGSSGVIADGASASVNIVAYKGYALYKVSTSVAATIQLYTNAANRTLNTSQGQICSISTVTPGQTVSVTPAIIGFNDEATPTGVIPVLITNHSGSPADITFTLTLLKLEV